MALCILEVNSSSICTVVYLLLLPIYNSIVLIALSFGQPFWGRFRIILRSKVNCVWNYDQKENWSEMLFDIVNMDKARDLGSKAATRLFSGKMYIAPMIHLYHNPCIHRMWGSNPRPHG